MSWNEYLDEYGQEAEYDETKNWEIRVNDETVEYFDCKEEALKYLMEEIDSLSNEEFFKNVGLLGYSDEEECFYTLIDMCASDFYEEMVAIYETFSIEEEFKLINLDNNEPEYGEL